MKISFRFIAKIGLLLVVLGFFMPVISSVGNGDGFRLAQNKLDFNETFPAILLYVVFCAAAAGCIIGVLLLLKRKIKIHFDWICVLASIGSGLIVYFAEFGGQNLQTGAYLILAGWIIALIAQFLSLRKKER